MPMATSMMASLTSSSSPQTVQRYKDSSGGGPKGTSKPSCGIGSWRLRRILSFPHGFQLIMDHPIGRVPDTPHLHSAVTVRTAQGVSPAAPLIPLTIGQGSDDLNRPLDEALDLGQGLLNEAPQLGKRLGRLHPVIPHPLEAFGKHVLNHPADKRIDIHRFSFHPLARVRTVVIGDPLAIIAVDAPQRDWRTHHI